jgi:hypothetical protein
MTPVQGTGRQSGILFPNGVTWIECRLLGARRTPSKEEMITA